MSYSEEDKKALENIVKHCGEIETRKKDNDIFHIISYRLDFYSERIRLLNIQMEKRDKEISELKDKLRKIRIKDIK